MPKPTLTLTQTEARRFLVAHQRLLPSRTLAGKAGVLSHVQTSGCPGRTFSSAAILAKKDAEWLCMG